MTSALETLSGILRTDVKGRGVAAVLLVAAVTIVLGSFTYC